MTKRARGEAIILSLAILVFIALLGNAVWQARQTVRDGLRQQDITNLKRALEKYNNRHNSYPAPLEGATACTAATDNDSWFFGDRSVLLKEGDIDAIPHDLREKRGYVYRYCATNTDNKTGQGYFIEAQLEQTLPPIIAFDEDESRKFTYQILSENGKTLYRVCGGTERQCDLIN